jgi:alcohol dehydrogenase YqhD (iron-dependent ADH family)
MRNFASDEQSISCKCTDWEVHMLGQGLAAVTNATHGHTLAAVTDAYYRLLIDKSADAVARFKCLAVNVWNVNSEGKDDKAVVIEGLETMEQWMRSLGLAMTITECGGKEEDIEKYCDATFINTTGYYTLTREDVAEIFRRSM